MKRLIIRDRMKMIVVKKAINGPTSSSFRHHIEIHIISISPVELEFSELFDGMRISSEALLKFMMYHSPSVCSNMIRRMAYGKF